METDFSIRSAEKRSFVRTNPKWEDSIIMYLKCECVACSELV